MVSLFRVDFEAQANSQWDGLVGGDCAGRVV
jgi:hypothetical protein